MVRRRIGIVLVLLATTVTVVARQPRVATVVKTWNMPDYTAVADSTDFKDTTMLNYHDVDVQQLYSISSTTNGNVLVSPIESRVINDRLRTIDDPFAWCFAPYVVTPQQQRFFNTTTPFSTIAYKKGFVSGHEENDIDFLFTGNINKRLNLGLDIDYLNSLGHYANTAGKLFRGSVWGSYTGAHYSMHGAFSWSSLSSFDNGGLSNVSDLSSSLSDEDLPVRLNAMTGYRYLSGFLHNQYAITQEREYRDSIEVIEDGQRTWRDTIKVEHIPLITFSHLFETNNSNRRYVEKTAEQGFYDSTYYDHSQTKDSTDVLTIRNTIAVTFCEAYNQLLKFGATVFAMNECQRFVSDSIPADSVYNERWMNNTYVGGAIHKHSGPHVHYNVEGKVCLLGYKIGEFDVNGKLTTRFAFGTNSLVVGARAYVRSEKPNWYLQHFRSNHLKWDNNFGFTYRFLGGHR